MSSLRFGRRFGRKAGQAVRQSVHRASIVYSLSLRHQILRQDSGPDGRIVLQLIGYGFQVGLILFAARRSGDGNRATRAWIARWGKASGTAWGDRLGQDVHDGEGHREAESSDAGAGAQ